MMAALSKILHIDDDLDILAISKMVLEGLGGFKLKQCSSGAEAVKVVTLFKPQLILLDAMMPEMSGLETLQEIRKLQEFADTPVIFMTAKAQPSEIQELTDAGAAGVITKPFEPVALPDQIRDIWNQQKA